MKKANKRILVGSTKKLAILKRDNYTCGYCNAIGIELEIDHIKPVSKGGTNELTNLITACKKCNREKSNSEDWLPMTKNTDIQVNTGYLFLFDIRFASYFDTDEDCSDTLLGFYKISTKDFLQRNILAHKLLVYDDYKAYEIRNLMLTDTQMMNIKYYNSYEEMDNDYAIHASQSNRQWTIKNRPNWNFLDIKHFYINSLHKY